MPGTTLQNRYRLDAELGQDGMGRVYCAHDTPFERDVAIKVLTAPTVSDMRKRWLREAQATAQLSLLTGAAARSCRATIDWSYNLLSA